MNGSSVAEEGFYSVDCIRLWYRRGPSNLDPGALCLQVQSLTSCLHLPGRVVRWGSVFLARSSNEHELHFASAERMMAKVVMMSGRVSPQSKDEAKRLQGSDISQIKNIWVCQR